MLFGLAPIKIAGCKKNDKILGIANSFSGGVFLAIAFVHILPETSDIYYDAKLQSLLDSKRGENSKESSEDLDLNSSGAPIEPKL